MKQFTFPALDSILTVERALRNVLGPHVYVGGACVGFYIDDPGAAEVRPTDDVDLAVEITTEVERVQLDDALRKAGLTNDLSGPICRWRLDELRIDIMPTDSRILGFSNQWYPEALAGAQRATIYDLAICIPHVATFLATKIDAFNDRGNDDFGASSDFEDIIRVLDGCSKIPEETLTAPPAVREYMREAFRNWLQNRDFADAIAMHLLDEGGSTRTDLVVGRMKDF